ncbi:MAG: hypothetical protein ACREM8_05725, partial [Vulcanimicrobiaceae bacterium]
MLACEISVESSHGSPLFKRPLLVVMRSSPMRNSSISRDAFITGAAVGAAALSIGVPAFVPKRTEAEETIKIGETDELTGTYAALGLSQQRGETLAMEKWNKRG